MIKMAKNKQIQNKTIRKKFAFYSISFISFFCVLLIVYLLLPGWLRVRFEHPRYWLWISNGDPYKPCRECLLLDSHRSDSFRGLSLKQLRQKYFLSTNDCPQGSYRDDWEKKYMKQGFSVFWLEDQLCDSPGWAFLIKGEEPVELVFLKG